MSEYQLRLFKTTERSEARRWQGIILQDGEELYGEWSRVFGPDRETVIRKAKAIVDKQQAYWRTREQSEELIDLS